MKYTALLMCLLVILLGQNDVCFEIEENPDIDEEAFSCFTKYINVLDCFKVYAENSVQDAKVLHVAAVAAELLDNDEDGVVDDPAIFNALQESDALMPVFTYDGNYCMDNFEDHYYGDGVSAVLFRNEIDPNNPGHWGRNLIRFPPCAEELPLDFEQAFWKGWPWIFSNESRWFSNDE